MNALTDASRYFSDIGPYRRAMTIMAGRVIPQMIDPGAVGDIAGVQINGRLARVA